MKATMTLGLLFAAACAVAQPDEAQKTSANTLLGGRPLVSGPLTRDEAVEIALRESPVVRGAVAEVDAAAARVAAARAERRPMVSANAFLTAGNNAAILPSSPVVAPQAFMGVPRDNFADLNLMLMVPLYQGGRLRAMTRAASAMREASESELSAMRQEVALMTRTAYNAVLARREMVAVWQARLDEDNERLRLDRARLEQEQIPAYYLRRDEAEVAATRQELTNAQRDVEIALVQLKTVLGVRPESEVEVSGALAAPPIEELRQRLGAPDEGAGAGAWQSDLLPLDALLRHAEQARPELAAARQRVRGARDEADSVRGAYRPQVNAMAMADWMSMEGEGTRTGTTVGVVASLPLVTGGMRKARVAEAEAERRREEQERERTALRIGEEVQTALLNLRAARQNVEATRAELVAANAEYEAANLRYQVGRSLVVEALDAQATRIRAQSNTVQAIYGFTVAYDQLLRAIGALDPPPTGAED